jgi:transposase
MERLNLNTICDIIYRLRQGQTQRAIERDLGHSRHTLRKYHAIAEAKGYLDPSRPLPEPDEIVRELGVPAPPPSAQSTVEPYRDVVAELMKQDVEMATIYRRLVSNHSYRGSYSSVKRFVQRIRPAKITGCIRIETAPGREAQVDFGSAGRQRDPKTGKTRQAYCFIMKLSFSRHFYGEIVFDQKMATWIRCHRNAFESFGGVPEEVVIDNLKAAVLEASLENQTLSIPYKRFAAHYGIIVHPCRPYKPEHKGKVESDVHFVKRAFLAGQDFVDIDDANRKLREWIINEAGTREHGTTHEAPLLRFHETEKAALMPLPREPFELTDVYESKVHRDGFVQVAGSYYHAPREYIGKKLDVFVYERTLQIYDGVTLLVTHERATRKGERKTREEFYPEQAGEYVRRTRSQCKYLALLVGPQCAEVVENLLTERPLDKLRSVHGILRLQEKYSAQRLESACGRALHYNDPSYPRVKRILASGLDQIEAEAEKQQGKLEFYEHSRKPEEFFPGIALEAVAGRVERC